MGPPGQTAVNAAILASVRLLMTCLACVQNRSVILRQSMAIFEWRFWQKFALNNCKLHKLRTRLVEIVVNTVSFAIYRNWLKCTTLYTLYGLTHWGRVTHICVGKLTIIASDKGLSPERRQAIIWTNAGLLLIGPLRTNFSEILIGIQIFSFKKMHLKLSSAKWRPFASASIC